MQELRIVAVSEDGSYAVLAVPGRGGRFSLPIDDRLRIVARAQFSRLAQYEIEVESPLRPKEIQDRIRAGETAEEIADAAGVPIERVRRFEGPVLAERAYRAQEAQRATIRRPGDSGPGPRLSDIVEERLAAFGASAEESQWDSRKRADGSWQVQLLFTAGGRPHMAEWVFDPPRRHVSPDDDTAARLSLPEADLAALEPEPKPVPQATVTPIGSRMAQQVPPARSAEPPPEPAGGQARTAPAPREAEPHQAGRAAPGRAADARAAEVRAAEARAVEARAAEVRAAAPDAPAEAGHQEDEAMPQRGRARKAAGGRSRRSSVPSWDEIMFGTSRQPE